MSITFLKNEGNEVANVWGIVWNMEFSTSVKMPLGITTGTWWHNTLELQSKIIPKLLVIFFASKNSPSE